MIVLNLELLTTYLTSRLVAVDEFDYLPKVGIKKVYWLLLLISVSFVSHSMPTTTPSPHYSSRWTLVDASMELASDDCSKDASVNEPQQQLLLASETVSCLYLAKAIKDTFPSSVTIIIYNGSQSQSSNPPNKTIEYRQKGTEKNEPTNDEVIKIEEPSKTNTTYVKNVNPCADFYSLNNHHVILESVFSDVVNAQRRVSRLKSIGFSRARIIPLACFQTEIKEPYFAVILERATKSRGSILNKQQEVQDRARAKNFHLINGRILFLHPK